MDWARILWAALILIVTGAAMAFSLRQAARLTRLRRGGTSSPGTIASVDSVPGNRSGRRTVRTVFRFETADGRAVEAYFSGYSSKLKRGRHVTVVYDPANPESAEVLESGGQRKGWLVAASAAGVLVLVHVYALLRILDVF